MKSERARPNEIEPPLAQVTDSMVLTETYVDAAIRRHRVSLSESLRPAQGIVNSVFLGLLFWLLTLLIVIVF
jgi:hypothetical protein